MAQGADIQADRTSPLSQFVDLLVRVPEVLERLIQRDAEAARILEAANLREAQARSERRYWDRQRSKQAGKIVRTSRIWTRRDERHVNLERGLASGFSPERRTARYLRRLVPRSGLSKHEQLFRLAIDEARRDGTAGVLAGKLERARDLFEKLLSAARSIAEGDGGQTDFSAAQVELTPLVSELVDWTKPPPNSPSDSSQFVTAEGQSQGAERSVMTGGDCSTVAGIFAAALKIAEDLAPLNATTNVDGATAGAYGQHVARRLRELFDGLNRVPSIPNIPPDVLSALKSLARIVRIARTECVAYGDMALHLARSDMANIAKNGWGDLMKSRPKNQGMLSWADEGDEAKAEPRLDEDFIDRLLAGPPDVTLTQREMAFLEARLKTRRSLQEMADPTATANHKKLRLIHDFNRNLQKLSVPATEAPLDESLEPKAESIESRPSDKDEAERPPIHDEQTEVIAEIAKPSKREQRVKWLAEAMLLVQEHPEWPDADIARSVDKHPSTLSRNTTYQTAAALARKKKDKLRKGHQTVDPDSGSLDVEAYADPDDPAERDWDM